MSERKSKCVPVEKLLEQINEWFEYEPETGIWRRKKITNLGASIGHYVGQIITAKDTHGYIEVRVCGVRYSGHRLAWLVTRGKWPAKHLDHINRDRADNRIANLRECDNAQNAANHQRSRVTETGYFGVSRERRGRKPWVAQIYHRSQKIRIGYFVTPEAAARAYDAKARELKGEFARCNFPEPVTEADVVAGLEREVISLRKERDEYKRLYEQMSEA